MTRLAVVADAHCDEFGARIDPASGLNARWLDSVRMLEWVAADARDRGCEALVVAGDLTENRHPAPWRVAQIGEALAAFGGPTILARGNHDGLHAGRSIVDVLAQGRQDWSGYSRPGLTKVGGTVVAVLPYLDRHYLRAQPGFESVPEADLLDTLQEQYLLLARALYASAAPTAAEGTVLVVHQALAGGRMSEAQQAFLGDATLVVDTRALAAIGFDAIVAGHFHLHQVLSERPLVAYAGSPTRTDFGEEAQAKYYLVVDVAAGGATFEAIETPARRFVTLTAPRPDDAFDVRDAIVRCVDVDPDVDTAELRRVLEADGPFEIVSIARRRAEAIEAVGMSESLAPADALAEYFAGDDDAEALVSLGRSVLAEVA